MRRSLSVVAPVVLATACAAGTPSPPIGPGPTEPPGAATASGAYDVIVEGGRIVDGTGNAWYPGDVGIRGDRIVAITPPGMLADVSATRRVDATGKVVSPGFIDIQSHSRSSFLGGGDGRVVSKVTMGVTTEIMGESTTNAPSSPAMLEAAGPAAGTTQFETFGEWIEAMEDHGASVNFGSFVGATTIRDLRRVVGRDGGARRERELRIIRWRIDDPCARNGTGDGCCG